MVRKSKQTSVNKSDFKKFLDVSKNFYEGAKVAYEFEYYNAAGVLVVHAAIALGDSLTIKTGGVKCRGENHYEILYLIKEEIKDDVKRNTALKHLEAILSHKNSVSYLGDIYYKADVDKLFKYYDRFSKWAYIILES